MSLFFLLITSMLCAAGMAIVLVEKRFDWPVRPISIILRRYLQVYVHRKMHRMPKCAVCLAFWAALLSDAAVCIASGGSYFLWPLSGFAAAGAVWALYEVLRLMTPVSVQETRDIPYPSQEMIAEAHAEIDDQIESSEWTDKEHELFRHGELNGSRTILRDITKVWPVTEADMEVAKADVVEALETAGFYNRTTDKK